MSNLIKKVKEEIRKGCFALYYDMSDKELTSIPDHDTYFRTLLAARDFGTSFISIFRSQNTTM